MPRQPPVDISVTPRQLSRLRRQLSRLRRRQKSHRRRHFDSVRHHAREVAVPVEAPVPYCLDLITSSFRSPAEWHRVNRSRQDGTQTQGCLRCVLVRLQVCFLRRHGQRVRGKARYPRRRWDARNNFDEGFAAEWRWPTAGARRCQRRISIRRRFVDAFGFSRDGHVWPRSE